MNFKEKTVVVTGASGGMGIILCERLAAQGAKLALCSKDSSKLDILTENLKKYNTEIFAKAFDISNETEVSLFMEEAHNHLGDFSALANLAGLCIQSEIPTMDVNDYDKTIDINVKGPFLTSKHFAAHAADEAIIVNVGSMAAINANGIAPLYCSAKAALNMFSKASLIQLGKKNIRVSTVNPGGTDTPFWDDIPGGGSNLMQAEQVVDVIEFVLCSDPRIQIHEISFESFSRFN